MTSITVTTTNGDAVIEADVYGQYAVHQSVYKVYGSDAWKFMDDWIVTHVPSGMAVPQRFTKEAAEALAMYLAQHPRTAKTAAVSDIEAVVRAVRTGFRL